MQKTEVVKQVNFNRAFSDDASGRENFSCSKTDAEINHENH